MMQDPPLRLEPLNSSDAVLRFKFALPERGCKAEQWWEIFCPLIESLSDTITVISFACSVLGFLMAQSNHLTDERGQADEWQRHTDWTPDGGL